MTTKYIRDSIGSYKARMERYKKMAKDAIDDDMYDTAAGCLAQAAKCKGAIEDLEFVLECSEVEDAR